MRCDICDKETPQEYFDAKTKQGPWATMCSWCFRQHGIGLGLGRGQRYQRNVQNNFVKTEG